jgi:CMP-N-acetylneuraminic acid synthetase
MSALPSPARARLAVIPARGGSKRVPRKNVRILAGLPLLVYSIRAARDCGLFDAVVVSTDDEEIAALALREGADVPFRRADDLADDHTPVSRVTLDALVRVDPSGARFGAVAQLMPNCPLRTAEDVRESYVSFDESGAAAQISVTRFGWQNPWWAFRLGPDNTMEPLFSDSVTRRSQDLPPLFCPTGAIWWVQADVLRSSGTYHVAGRRAWEMPWQRGLDIDTEDDFAIAEMLAGSPGSGAVVHV